MGGKISVPRCVPKDLIIKIAMDQEKGKRRDRLASGDGHLRRRWRRQNMDLPGGDGDALRGGGVVSPEALDEASRRNSPSNQVLLSLMLLHFESEPATQDALQEKVNA